MSVSKSPERHTFQLEMAKDRAAEDGKEVPEFYKNFWKTAKEQSDANLVDTEWQKDNMEWDLRTTEWILEKVRASESYAQNLYAAMCNNDFQKQDVWPVLKGKTWSASWRYAGGIIADMREKGDYIDWYCSGIRGVLSAEEYSNLNKEQQQHYLYAKNNFVGEGHVTDEICSDLRRLGWDVATANEDTD